MEWPLIPIFLPGEFHEQRSLGSYGPWGCKESDTTRQLTHTHICTHTHTYTHVHTSIDIMDPYDLCMHNGMRFDPKKYSIQRP